jgi:hypothetical protein
MKRLLLLAPSLAFDPTGRLTRAGSWGISDGLGSVCERLRTN